jgi:tRNA(Arg) A34 adenosine deaminase TadA
MFRLHRFLFGLFAIVVVFGSLCWCSITDNGDNDDQGNENGEIYGPDDVVNGISPQTRAYWIRYALNIQKSAQGPCPFGAFGAVIVNRTSNTLVCEYNGDFQIVLNDPTAHAEMTAIRDCVSKFPGRAADNEFWQSLSLYSTGEPCPMDMSAIRWSRFGEVIWATSIKKLIRFGWPQINIRASYVNRKSRAPLLLSTIEIGNVLTNETDVYFSWQFDPSAPCPQGCHRIPNGGILGGPTCVPN